MTPTANALPHCTCQRCRGSAFPAVPQRSMLTDRMINEPSARRPATLPSPHQSVDSCEDNLGSPIVNLVSDGSLPSASLCRDYPRAQMVDDRRLDDMAAAAARPTAKTSADFMAEIDDTFNWPPPPPVIDIK